MSESSPVIPNISPVVVPEMVEDAPVAPMTPENAALIEEAIAYIYGTISAKALETAILIGDYILTRFFNDDMEAAFSKNSDKPVSFNMLCGHPDLCVSRDKLINMVKVAAQERFFRSIGFDSTGLPYSHQLRLTRLPNGETKTALARTCIAENWTIQELASRIRTIVLETGTGDGLPATNPYEKAATDLISAMEQLTRKAGSLNMASKTDNLTAISIETRGLLKTRVIALTDSLGNLQTECEMLLKRILLMENPR